METARGFIRRRTPARPINANADWRTSLQPSRVPLGWRPVTDLRHDPTHEAEDRKAERHNRILIATISAGSGVLVALITVFGTIAATNREIVPQGSGPTIERTVTVAPTATETVTVYPDDPTTSPTGKGGTQYQLNFGDKTSVDLDTGRASRDGGKTYEVRLDFGRFFTGQKYGLWEIATVAFIDISQASFAGCDRATLIQGEVTQLSKLKQDQAICVHTDKGAWAVLNLISAERSASGLGTGDIKFDVHLYKN
jgi:hypothetical protein